MKIAILDPFYDESHRYWAEGLQRHSSHDITIYHNPPRNWKWQMVGGTLAISNKIKDSINTYDLLVVTDMLDLPCFLGYLKGSDVPPILLYFHENQITYPWSSTDPDVAQKRDHHFGFMNLRSALMADHLLFNSEYHKNSFLGALPGFIKMFPPMNWPFDPFSMADKSSVGSIGLEYVEGVRSRKKDEKPIFVWNHRWEYDKNPTHFFEILFQLKDRGVDFGLIVLGRSYNSRLAIFNTAKEKLKNHIIHWGYAESRDAYTSLLEQSNISMVTSNQDFFGISVVEAIYYGNYPLLPNRLAYPEHINPNSSYHLYDDGQLMDRLMYVIDNQLYRDSTDSRNYIRKYEWEHVIAVYDELFSDFV